MNDQFSRRHFTRLAVGRAHAHGVASRHASSLSVSDCFDNIQFAPGPVLLRAI
jgi:hypothetical protein